MKAMPGAVVYRRALLAKRQEVRAGLAARGERLPELSEDDLPQLNQHEAVAAGLNTMGYAQLRLVQEALDRLAAGDYGVCLECDEPIPPQRLEAVPWARFCVRCQQRKDELAALLRDLLHDDRRAVG